ncbi:sugar transferase [Cereibacter sediminicola]|uniref:sugar transferase n=1 Tax=Cereibacter sediminicola TaxID=2584941 RepID=UPI00119D35F8|nr:sugar transferase [Cereibacter sediminicola]
MTPAKRLLDLIVALALVLVLALPFALLLLILLVVEGRPLFYVAERMRAPNEPFQLWKLRTMRPAERNDGVSGGDKTDRITRTGRFLRRTRLDEIPQLWNVLRGDMSFVGPRPPLRRYVEDYPDLYARVLRSRPGITGLASLHFHRHEEGILAQCRTAEETDRTYRERCIPRKAELDLIYQQRRTLCLDLALMYQTVARVMVLRNRQPFAKERTA